MIKWLFRSLPSHVRAGLVTVFLLDEAMSTSDNKALDAKITRPDGETIRIGYYIRLQKNQITETLDMSNPSDDPRDFDPMPADLPDKVMEKLNEDLDKKENK